jgi:TetR/AcrR family transcriptional repressor of nem operon
MVQARQDIIEAAAVLMESKGYNNTNISEILDVSNTGKGQFYYYFHSKRDLGLAAVDHYFSSFKRDLLENILGSDKSPEVKIEEMLEWIVAVHQAKEAKCGCAFGNLALEMSEHDEGFREKLNSVFAAWTAKLESVLNEMPRFSADPAEVQKLAQGIVCMIEGGILLMKNNRDVNVLKDMCGWIRVLIDACSAVRKSPEYRE